MLGVLSLAVYWLWDEQRQQRAWQRLAEISARLARGDGLRSALAAPG
jgi:hypothetical protein